MSVSQDIRSVGAYEAKTHLADLLAKVEAGEEITITRHGSPIAKLVPVKKKPTAEQRRLAIKRIQKLGRSLRLGSSIKDMISQGRK